MNTLLHSIETENPKQGTVDLWFLGGSSFGIKFHDQKTIFVDLDAYAGLKGVEILANGRAPGLHLERRIFLPFDPQDITQEAAYLSTHEHEDHCDRGSAQVIIERGGIFVGPRSSCELANNWGFPQGRVKSLDGDKFEKTSFGDVEILAAPGNDPNAQASNTYLLSFDDICVLHNGDAGYDGRNYLEIASKSKIDAAIINLGKNSKGRHWYHTPYDVARAANDLEPRYLIPHHYDKWDKALEDPARVRIALDWSYPELANKVKLIVPRVGEKVEIERAVPI
jgi:L-ascorbate metabolism protein UlaG (beta-lactamase superfamily)